MGTQVVNRKRILGIDPGLNTTGYAVIEVDENQIGPQARIDLCEAGIVRSRSADQLEQRIQEIFDGVSEVIANQHPDSLALEQLFSHYERPRTAILMGHARGAICLAAARADIPVHHYEPTRVKKVMTGNGRAPKSQIQQAVKLQLRLTSVPEPADVADAMAIAICGHHLGGMNKLLG
ncbi:MAG: crossover junction endodeoxyribonuclease RuvC [Planctomycetota bacterium]